MNTELVEHTDMEQFERELAESDTFDDDLVLKGANGRISDLIEEVRQRDEAGIVCRKGQLFPKSAYFQVNTLEQLTDLMQTFGSDAIVERRLDVDQEGETLVEYRFD